MSFSPAFQELLRGAIQKANITPATFLKEFEEYISNPANRSPNGKYYFKLSYDFQQCLSKSDCLNALENNLKACGFTISQRAYPEKGTFAFVKEEHYNQWQSETVKCSYRDCESVVIHM